MPVTTSCAHRSGLAPRRRSHAHDPHHREPGHDDADVQRLLAKAPARKRAARPSSWRGQGSWPPPAPGTRCIGGIGAHLRKRAAAGADVRAGERAEDHRDAEGREHGVYGRAIAAMRPYAARPPRQVHEHDEHREIPGREARGQHRQRPRRRGEPVSDARASDRGGTPPAAGRTARGAAGARCGGCARSCRPRALRPRRRRPGRGRHDGTAGGWPRPSRGKDRSQARL